MQMLYFTNLKEPDQKKYEEECGTLEGFEPWNATRLYICEMDRTD